MLPTSVPIRLFIKIIVLALIIPALAGCFSFGVVKGDNRPHPGVNRARDLPIQGLDVARYQGRIDFAAARNAGTQFVFMKATEGADYLDPNFRENWARARNAGMPRGAYHFMAWCSLAKDQANWFKRNVPADADALPPVLDLEWNNSSSCKRRYSREDTLEKIRLMLTEMEAHTGKMPIIYTDITFHRDVLEGEYFDNAFWLGQQRQNLVVAIITEHGLFGSGRKRAPCRVFAVKWTAIPFMAQRPNGCGFYLLAVTHA